MRYVYQFFFWLLGWKIIGQKPSDKKYIMIIAPHTSYWDFFVGVAARAILKLETKYLGKKEIFRFPLGGFLRWIGGYPVDRDNAGGIVESVIGLFNTHDEFSIALAPEGTRKKVDRLKSGFWRMAKGAGVPIVVVGFDYKRKVVELLASFMPGEMEPDMERIVSYYKNVSGKHPGNGLG